MLGPLWVISPSQLKAALFPLTLRLPHRRCGQLGSSLNNMFSPLILPLTVWPRRTHGRSQRQTTGYTFSLPLLTTGRHHPHLAQETSTITLPPLTIGLACTPQHPILTPWPTIMILLPTARKPRRFIQALRPYLLDEAWKKMLVQGMDIRIKAHFASKRRSDGKPRTRKNEDTAVSPTRHPRKPQRAVSGSKYHKQEKLASQCSKRLRQHAEMHSVIVRQVHIFMIATPWSLWSIMPPGTMYLTRTHKLRYINTTPVLLNLGSQLNFHLRTIYPAKTIHIDHRIIHLHRPLPLPILTILIN